MKHINMLVITRFEKKEKPLKALENGYLGSKLPWLLRAVL